LAHTVAEAEVLDAVPFPMELLARRIPDLQLEDSQTRNPLQSDDLGGRQLAAPAEPFRKGGSIREELGCAADAFRSVRPRAEPMPASACMESTRASLCRRNQDAHQTVDVPIPEPALPGARRRLPGIAEEVRARGHPLLEWLGEGLECNGIDLQLLKTRPCESEGETHVGLTPIAFRHDARIGRLEHLDQIRRLRAGGGGLRGAGAAAPAAQEIPELRQIGYAEECVRRHLGPGAANDVLLDIAGRYEKALMRQLCHEFLSSAARET
jgi:hypothetical protein